MVAQHDNIVIVRCDRQRKQNPEIECDLSDFKSAAAKFRIHKMIGDFSSLGGKSPIILMLDQTLIHNKSNHNVNQLNQLCVCVQ
jgi:hypothetical protein